LARIKAALALRRPDGQLHDRAWAQQQSTDTIGEWAGDAWGKGRRLLGEVRTLNHLDWRHEHLAQAVPEPWRREAVPRLRYGRGHMERTHGLRQAQATPLVIEAQMLCQRLAPEWPTA
jgi:hypothetical protein